MRREGEEGIVVEGYRMILSRLWSIERGNESKKVVMKT